MVNKVFIGLFAFLFVVSGVLGYFSYHLNSELNTLSDDQKAFKEDTTNKFTLVRADITSLDVNLNAFKTDTTNRFTNVEYDITNLDSRFTAYQAATDNRLSTAESNINSINTDLTDLAARFADSTMNVPAIYDEIVQSVCLITDGNSIGSGFIYSANGYVITCWHVINDMTDILIQLHDGTVTRATLIGSDKYSDIAVLKLTGFSNLKPLELGDSGALNIGEPVMVVGNPLAIFESATYGVISHLKEMVNVSGFAWPISNLIQIDAPTNPGNSGGPVVNRKGQVVGIASYTLTSAEGIHYAIDSNKIKRVAQAIIDHGSFTNVTLSGTWSISDISPEQAVTLGLERCFGVWFESVVGAGDLQANDVAIAIDGTAVKNAAELFSYIAEFKSVGDSVTLIIIRNHHQIEVNILLEEGWIINI